jgi:hypothetical protein
MPPVKPLMFVVERSEVEKTAPETCALKFPWRMMYGEKRVLKPPGLLMDNYHKVSSSHYITNHCLPASV